MKRTDARKPESGHALRSNQPFFGAQAATAFFTSGQSVQRDPFFQRSASASVPLQAKLTVGAVGDKYEQEADRVAATVVDQINRPAGPQGGDRSLVQRLGGEEEVQMQRSPDTLQRVEQEEELQMKPIADTIQRMGPAEEDELQMKPMPETIQRQGMEEDELQMKGAIAPQVTTQGGDVSSNLEASIQQARGGGQAIAENVRVPLEQAFGADFSGVRVHTDTKSDQLNQSIQAKAFTTGQNVFFRQGAYQPGSRGGQELIAHELTHVVQQNESSVRRSFPSILPQQSAANSYKPENIVAHHKNWQIQRVIVDINKLPAYTLGDSKAGDFGGTQASIFHQSKSYPHIHATEALLMKQGRGKKKKDVALIVDIHHSDGADTFWWKDVDGKGTFQPNGKDAGRAPTTEQSLLASNFVQGWGEIK